MIELCGKTVLSSCAVARVLIEGGQAPRGAVVDDEEVLHDIVSNTLIVSSRLLLFEPPWPSILAPAFSLESMVKV
jgi:hypothetical protein